MPGFFLEGNALPAGTKVAAVEAKLKKEYGANKGAVYGSKPSKKALQRKTMTLTHMGHDGPKRTVLA